jgi:hypothetical protein
MFGNVFCSVLTLESPCLPWHTIRAALRFHAFSSVHVIAVPSVSTAVPVRSA